MKGQIECNNDQQHYTITSLTGCEIAYSDHCNIGRRININKVGGCILLNFVIAQSHS